MRVLVIGSHGNMGRRYSAIVKYLHHELLQYDPVDKTTHMPEYGEYDCCIIATPVSEHLRYLKPIMAENTPVLCEKPLAFDIKQVQDTARFANVKGCAAYMVNNWAFVGQHREPMSEEKIIINCYNTGNDGAWDLIQPLYLVEDIENFECVRQLPYLSVEISGCVYGRDDFDMSCIAMVQAFLEKDYSKLWPAERMATAHERVIEYMQRFEK